MFQILILTSRGDSTGGPAPVSSVIASFSTQDEAETAIRSTNQTYVPNFLIKAIPLY